MLRHLISTGIVLVRLPGHVADKRRATHLRMQVLLWLAYACVCALEAKVHTAALQEKLDEANVSLTDCRSKADIIVVPDYSDVGQRSKFWAALRGTFLMTASALTASDCQAAVTLNEGRCQE